MSDTAKPDQHVWVKCPNGHGEITHQHFDYCGCCPECGAVMRHSDPTPLLQEYADDLNAVRLDAARYRDLLQYYAPSIARMLDIPFGNYTTNAEFVANINKNIDAAIREGKP